MFDAFFQFLKDLFQALSEFLGQSIPFISSLGNLDLGGTEGE